MKLNMSHIVKGLAAIAVCSVIIVATNDPAQAVLEGTNRDRMEYLDFSESVIKAGLYAKTGKVTFNHDKKKYVRGVKRHNEPRIYQPDVYTWQLAMNEHKKKMQALAPVQAPPTNVTPVPMGQDPILPLDPAPNIVEGQAARTDYKAEDIKRRIIEHMNSLDSRYPSNIPALQPAVYPKGRRGDSFDASF